MMNRRDEKEIEFALHMVEQLLRGQDNYLSEYEGGCSVFYILWQNTKIYKVVDEKQLGMNKKFFNLKIKQKYSLFL